MVCRIECDLETSTMWRRRPTKFVQACKKDFFELLPYFKNMETVVHSSELKFQHKGCYHHRELKHKNRWAMHWIRRGIKPRRLVFGRRKTLRTLNSAVMATFLSVFRAEIKTIKKFRLSFVQYLTAMTFLLSG